MVTISINPSRRLAFLLCIAHAIAAGTILAIDFPVWMTLAFIAMIGASCARALYGPALLRTGEAIVSLEIREEGTLSLQTRRGDWREGKLLGSSFVAPYLTVLNVRIEGSASVRHVVILPDSTDADDFRRLRVWLRWRQPGIA